VDILGSVGEQHSPTPDFLSLLVAVPVHIGTHTYSHRYKIFNAFDFLTNFDPLSYLKEIKIMKKINIYLNYIIK
jgi:hypothetical protein